MKRILILIILTGVITLSFVAINERSMSSSSPVSVTGTYAPVAVLELFTSEGCSSCPPADRLLPELRKLDSNVIPLSFHVDYWNRLGWKDPFSKSAFSDRQRHYGQLFRLESIYTPQLVINGKYEVLGSSRSDADAAIKKALLEKSTVKIHLDDIKWEGDNIKIICRVEGDIQRVELLAALVQKHATTHVKAGENDGATLSHINIVRSFEKQPATEKTKFSLKSTGNPEEKNWQLIIYAQQKDGKIVGALSYETPVN